MKDEEKTKEQLISELVELRQRIAKLEASESKRKRAQEEIAKRQKYLESVVYNAPDAIVALDSSHCIIEWNPGAERIFGYTRDEVVGKDIDNLISLPDAIHELKALTRQVLSGGMVLPFETVRYRKDGSPVNVIAAGSPIQIEGELHGVVAVYTDITDRKWAQEALHREKEKFRVLVEESPLGISYIKEDGHYEYVNPRFIEIFGYTLEDIPTGREWFKKAYPDEIYRNKVISIWTSDLKELRPGESRIRTFTVTCKDGSKKLIQFRPVTMESGDQFVICEDTTEMKRLEDQLQQAQKMEAIGTLAGGIAHDFNNILAAIIGYAELAGFQVDEDSNKAKDSLKEVIKAGHRAKNLIRQILAFSRQSEQERMPMQMRSIVKESIKLLRASLPTTIEIRQNIESDIGAIEADPTQMQQIIMNLCTNAHQAMSEEGGTMEINLSEIDLDFHAASQYPDLSPGKYVRLTVSDTGHGMDKEIMERIFEPYFTTKEKGRGTGLGLAVVHGIVKSHEGAITVHSEPGKGSAFHVYIPVIQWEVVEEKDEIEPLPTGHERILFIDDEPALVDIGKEMLEHLGYKVDTRTSSLEALELFKAQPDRFHLVITDMTMPNMTGDKLAQELMKILPDIPIILCTGFSQRITEEKAREMGIKAFAMKPLVMRDLANTVRKALGPSEIGKKRHFTG